MGLRYMYILFDACLVRHISARGLDQICDKGMGTDVYSVEHFGNCKCY